MITIDRVKLSMEARGIEGNIWAGMEAEITPDEDPIHALNQLKEKVTSFLHPPGSVITLNPEYAHLLNKKPVSDTLDILINDMNQCTAIDERNHLGAQVGLLAFADKMLDNQKFRDAYDKKLKELQP